MYDELGPSGLGMTPGVDLILYDNANDLMVALDGGAIDLAYIDGPVFTAWKGIYDIRCYLTQEMILLHYIPDMENQSFFT